MESESVVLHPRVVLSELTEFGFPIYVPASPGWEIAAVGLSNGKPSGVLVFAEGGSVTVTTESDASPHQPLSMQVLNVQLATLNGKHPSEGYRVMVDDEAGEVTVDGVRYPVRVLRSDRVFRFQLRIEDRTIHVAGHIDALGAVALSRLDSLDEGALETDA